MRRKIIFIFFAQIAALPMENIIMLSRLLKIMSFNAIMILLAALSHTDFKAADNAI